MTIVDELIVRLGLDPKDFEKGQKKAVQEFLKTRDAARKTGKDIEDTAKKTAASIERMTRNIIGMFAAFAGAKNLTELVTGLTKANAELGRFSANVGLAPQTVAAWGMAIQRVGGDAGNAQAFLSKLSAAVTNFRLGLGQMPQEFWVLMSKGGVNNVNPFDSMEETITKISTAVKTLSDSGDRQGAFTLAQMIGADDKAFEVLRQQGGKITEYIKDLEELAPSNKAIEEAQKLQKAWAELVQTIQKVVQDILVNVTPHLTTIVSSITAMVDRLTKDVDWTAIDDGMAQFADVVKGATENMDGLTLAVEGLFALWMGAKFTKMIANMLMFRGLAAGGAAAAGAGAAGAGSAGLLSMLGKAAPWVAMLLLSGSTAKDNKADLSDWRTADPNSEKFARYWDDVAKAKGWDRPGGSGPSSRGRGFSMDQERRQSLDSYLNGPEKIPQDTRVDGRPVSKGNPMPVMLANDGVGREKGFWEKVGDAVTSFFNGGDQTETPNRIGSNGGITPTSSDTQKTASGPSGVRYSAKSIREAMGISDAEWNAFREGLTDIEGKHYGRMGGFKGRYAGRYQMGPNEIRETADRLGVPVPSRQEFLSNPELQERFFENYTLDHHRTLMKSEKYRNMSALEKLQMLGYSHNQGAGGGLKYLRTGVGGRDGWGFDARKYFGTIRKRYEQMVKKGVESPIWDRPNEARAWPGQDTGGIGDLVGAQGTALTNSISNDNRQSSTSSNVDTRIGNVNVYTQATDSKSIADRLWDDLYNRIGQGSSAAAANTGPV